ncbi:Cytochrome P450 [Neofusicoccum parvum]|nr:Cytochrome P450 [Neofusicoccum parvum]
MKTKEKFVRYANEVMKQGIEECKGRIFQVIGANGPVIVLPPSFAEEIRNDHRLSFTGVIDHNFFPSYPGLEIFNPIGTGNDILQEVVRKNLTLALDGMTPVLSSEMKLAMSKLLPATGDWTPLKFFHVAPQLTARLSGRAFLGESLCRNDEWLNVSIKYTIDSFFAVRALRYWPPVLRPLVHRFLPEMRVVRSEVTTARRIIEAEVASRRRARFEAEMAGAPLKSTDAIGWFDDVAGDRAYDIVQEQMMLSVAAIHTTSVTLMALLYDLADHPAQADAVRAEIVRVLCEDGGWQKNSLYRMKLLDSCMKESQRLHTVGALAMNRRVEEAMTLSDGTHLPKGACLGIPTLAMKSTEKWGPDAEEFVGDRFLRLRQQPGSGNRWQFISTSADHMGFGYGRQACPGRFFASNQIKIAIVHLLLNYDWSKGKDYFKKWNMLYPVDNSIADDFASAQATKVSLLEALNGLPPIEEHNVPLVSSDDELLPETDLEGLTCRIKTLYEGPSKCDCCINWVETYPEDVRTAIEEDAETKRQALIVRMKKNHGDGGNPLVLDSVVVQSPLLKELLGEVFAGYNGITTSLKKLVFKAPFRAFYYRWERLVEAVKRLPEGDAAAHAQLLYTTLKAELKDTLAETKDLLANGVITYNYLWTVFEPGTEVFANEDGHDRFLKVDSCEYKEEEGAKFLEVLVKYVDWDGTRFGYASDRLKLWAFPGTKALSSLRVFPAKYHPALDLTKEAALERGRKFRDLSGVHYKAYSGIVQWLKDFRLIKRHVDGRVMIDAASHATFVPLEALQLSPFDDTSLAPSLDVADADTHANPPNDNNVIQRQQRLHPNGPPGMLPPGMPLPPWAQPKRSPTKDQQRVSNADDLAPQHLLLCSHLFRGYSLKIKQWVELFVSDVREIRWNDDAFPNLMLPAGYKKLILSFVQSQVANKAMFDDLIEGKGQGMIMLLAGSPGVGKTLTAEAVADNLRRPLYVVGAGELSENARHVEHQLSMMLDVAAKWDAVLLVDECDVFLEQRSMHDLARNRVVAVFLRLLEYYRGILFMTTNRAETIDPAFQSRIHLSIHYPALDVAAKKHIWKRLVENSKHKSVMEEKDFESLAQLDMNGRQIKNAVKTAQLLACKDDVPLNAEHIRTVLLVTQGTGEMSKSHSDQKIGKFVMGFGVLGGLLSVAAFGISKGLGFWP